MGHSERYIGANDNYPAWVTATSVADIKKNTFARAAKRPSQKRRSDFKGLAWLIPAMVFASLALYFIGGLSFQSLPTIAAFMGLIGLVWAKRCRRLELWRNREFTLLGVIGALSVSLFTLAQMSGIVMTGVDIAVMAACFSAILAWSYRSIPSLLVSVFANIIWLLSSLPDVSSLLGFGEAVSQGWLPFVPVLIIAQLFLTSHLKSMLCAGLTLVAAYGWAIWFGTASGMPVSALAGLGFAVGAAHYGIGQAKDSTDQFAAMLHTICGAIVALVSAHILQSIWLDSAMNQSLPGWIPTQIWWVGFGLAAMILFTSSILRFKYSRMTLLGVFLISLGALLLPLASIRPDLVRSLMLSVPGLSPAPGFGIMIGGVLMSFGLAWVVKGLRDMKLVHVILGAAIIGIQTLILIAPDRTTLDLGILFTCSLIAALCVGGLVAGSDIDHARPSRHMA